MSEDFDPYRKWLGIPPGQRPPDHYSLLGIGQFEDDPDTISNAADRQMAHLRTFQTGTHSALSQKLLNEIAAARLTLLDSAKKAEYDRQLQASAGSQAPPAAVDVPSPPVPAFPAPAPPVARLAMPLQPPTAQPVSAAPLQAPIDAPPQELIDLRETAARKKTPLAASLAGVLLLLLLGGSGAFYLIVRRGDAPREAANDPLVDAIHHNVPAASAPVAEATDGAPVPASELAASEDATETLKPTPLPPKLEIIEARWGVGDRWQDFTERMRSLVSNEQLLASTSGSLFEGVPDPAYGTAKQVRIRYRAAGETGEAEYRDGELIYLDGRTAAARKPPAKGLQVLEARYGAGATWLDVLPRVSRWVYGDRLSVRVSLTAPTDPAPNQRKALFLRYRTGDGEFVTHAWDDEELIVDARPVATAGKPQDLIAVADPARHSLGGWRKEGDVLIAPDASTDNLAIPTALDDEYLLTAVFSGSPRPFDVGVTLPVGDRQVQLALAGWSGAVNALQLVDGAAGDRNATTRQGTMFERGESTTVHCSVRKSGIKVTCNGRVAVDWHGERSTLSAPPESLTPESPAVVLRSQSNPWRIVRLEVSPLAAEPAPPAPSDEVVDLLERIDPELDAVAGRWQMTDEGLLSPEGDAMRIGTPYSPPDDYELRVVASTKSPSDAFAIGLVAGGMQTQAVIDGWGGTLTGLHGLDGEFANHNVATRPGRVFVDEQPREFLCTVHPSSVRVACEDKVLIDWHGDSRRFSRSCGVPDELGLHLAAWKTHFLVSKFELRALPPESRERPTSLAQPVDVLEQIDLQRDAVHGDWTKVDGALLAPVRQWARLQLPVLPPEEYTLRVEELGARDVTLGIVVGGRQVAVTLDGWSGEMSGISNAGGRSGDRNATTHHGNVLRDDGPNVIVCTVHRGRVQVACNGNRVIDWQGDPSSLSLLRDWIVPDDRRLFVGSWSSPFRITRIELSATTAATGSGSKTEGASSGVAADSRLPEPSGKELAAAEKQVAEKFDAEWKAAKNVSERLAVARKMYEAGVQTVDDRDLRYALLREASRQAAELGDASLACDAVEQLGREFQIDALAEKLAVAGMALEKARSGAQNWNLALGALLLADRALADERYEEARKFASLAAAASRRTRHHDLSRYAQRQLARVRNRHQGQARLDNALASLREDPDDAAANLAAGLELCLFQGEWRRGLPLLARSGDARLSEIASLENEAGEDLQRRAALVEAWLAEAEQRNGELRTECQLQARYWYDRGLPADVQLPKTALEKLTSLPGISGARVAPGLDMAMFDGGDFQQFRARRVDAQICHNYGFGSPDPAVPGDYFSIRWTGWIKPPLPGKYLFKSSSDDSIRVRINDKLVIDHWNRGAGDEVAEVELTDQLQPFSVEYNDYTANASVCLSWALKDLSDFQVLPAELLFHDPAITP